MAGSLRTIRDLAIEGRRLFIRVDFNVPLENGKVTDKSRVEASLPTIKHAIERGAKVVLASHAGRPKGKRNGNYKRGLFTAENLHMRRTVSALIRASRQSLAKLSGKHD